MVEPLPSAKPHKERKADAQNATPSSSLVIGLVNNMSGSALHSTTKQFWSLLEEAGHGENIRLRIFSPFADARLLNRDRVFQKCHEPIERLWTSKFDGMIVTGTEPKAVRLADEPCWPFLARLVDWSEHNVGSTIWSCLATQAAVFHLDRVERQPLDRKLSGVFDCEVSESHPVLDGYPHSWRVAHSRYNDLPESALVSHGYRILARCSVAGVDTFMKQRKALHFFLQGHMEYNADVLAREFRRDVRRYLTHETNRFPEVPANFFSQDAERDLFDFRTRAFQSRDLKLLADVPLRLSKRSKAGPWRPIAVQFYRNWLTLLVTQKSKNPRGSEKMREDFVEHT